MRPMPTMPRRLPVMRWPSIQVGDQPAQASSGMTRAPSAMRRATARTSAIVMSAVSSVSTPGVLVTVMPRDSADWTSILSTPLPKLAISLRFSPAWASKEASILSVTLGTRTSAVRTASISSAGPSGASVTLRRASKSSRIRVSTTSGSLRVTTTSGFLLVMVFHPIQAPRRRASRSVNDVRGTRPSPADRRSRHMDSLARPCGKDNARPAARDR